MSDAAKRLDRTRLAILEHITRRDPRRRAENQAPESDWQAEEPAIDGTPRPQGRIRGRFAGFRRAISAWWRHHPAHLGLELATPALSNYAARKPVRYLGIAAAVGALIVVTRPWRVVSITGVLVALAKSSQLSGLVMSALSAADYPRDGPPYL